MCLLRVSLRAPPARKCRPDSGRHPAGGAPRGVRASSSQSLRGASAPGLRLPPCRQGVTRPRPDSPHCLERAGRRPRLEEDGRNRRGEGRVGRKGRQRGGLIAPQLAFQVLPSSLSGELPGPPGKASSNEACTSPGQRSCQGENAGQCEDHRAKDSGDLPEHREGARYDVCQKAAAIPAVRSGDRRVALGP